MCGPYTKSIKLTPRDWLTEDQMEYMIYKINSRPEHIYYKFFARPKFVNWILTFNELVLSNFEFSSLIKSIAESFEISNGLEDGYEGWAFNFKYKDKFVYDVGSWDEFKLHSYPEISQFVERILQINITLDTLVNKILLMTNANHVELSDLKDQFSQNKLELTRFEPKLDLIPEGVKWTVTHSLVIEMELATRGKYFIGNRHNSIESNLLALRGIDKRNESSYLMY
ncbi:hypothetical protein CONCODRAFT_11682 [Conidiobolus coronatus NRRL 28638]|uniref:Uncharacterized protein n=1 Tax=Conidiobolus coronatus (strain ATCC 28846 / CBS 209.66 / NRRL 28638) TaxID=796925 RepID=A0A137NUH7_CONC2|nr:hypothetical protein CONCODRAFT_11682 [Conidiobolus coronatus NRRL 28638]|eukprot:KXN66465.1 hypothetical protein CONCODRAFT_11682 [Conidiobolus coronatus NRRL 28638]